jgi:hypothetical protein
MPADRGHLPVAQRSAAVALQLTSYLLYHGIVGVVSSLAGHIRCPAGLLQTFGEAPAAGTAARQESYSATASRSAVAPRPHRGR